MELKNRLCIDIHEYRLTSDISLNLVANEIIDFIPGFNGLIDDNCKTRQETFSFWDLVHLILEVWQYFFPIFYTTGN